jgi:hypothetical protein
LKAVGKNFFKKIGDFNGIDLITFLCVILISGRHLGIITFGRKVSELEDFLGIVLYDLGVNRISIFTNCTKII